MSRFKFLQMSYPIDPDTDNDIALEIWKDGETGAIFAVEASYLDQVEDMWNPYTGEVHKLPLPDDPESRTNTSNW